MGIKAHEFILFHLSIYLNLKWLISLFPDNRFHHTSQAFRDSPSLLVYPHGIVCPEGTAFVRQHVINTHTQMQRKCIFICKYASIHIKTYLCVCTHVNCDIKPRHIFHWHLQTISWLGYENNLGLYTDVLLIKEQLRVLNVQMYGIKIK